jgi:hypothetical protein
MRAAFLPPLLALFCASAAAIEPPVSPPKGGYPTFRDAEIRMIQEFYRPGSGNLPPGLAKKDPLPPGLAQQLKKKGTIPAGFETRLEPFPGDLARRLPDPPDGFRRSVVGNVALLTQDTTLLIVDVIPLRQ